MSARFTHIIHIADLHIRTGDPDRARIDEYKVVLDEFLKIIKQLDCVREGTALTVIAGDVFHNKGRIESAGFKLFSRFVSRLSVITPVVLICGNHDYRQEDPNIPDMLESMLDPWLDNDRVKYLQDTGHYEFNNIGFGVVSVKDTLRSGNTSGIGALPTYPSVGLFSSDVTRRIALFHGTVKACKLQNGTDTNVLKAYPLEWFKGYDMLLLGDVHKQQLSTYGGMPWGYPGSLVQQDFGESIYGHGFLLWDVETCTATAHHVPNTFGLVTMRNTSSTFDFEVYTGHREWVPLEIAAENPAFPKRPMVRVYDATYTDTDEALKQYQVYARNIHIMASSQDQNTSDEPSNDIEPLSDLCQPQKWKEYMNAVAPHLSTEVSEWFDAPEMMNIPTPSPLSELPTAVVTKINDRMSKIVKLLHAYREALGSQGANLRNRITLKNVAWDYTLCYGQGNHFNFDAIHGNIALLNGKNASGKSSFMEMLCLGLFGEQLRTRMVSGKKMSAKVIHSKKPQNKRAMNIRVMFKINDNLYEVIREFGTQADKNNISQFGVELFCIDESQQNKTLVREGTTAVNAWMEKNLGSMENVLLSNFITQLDQANFFMLKQDEQKNILERALHLESITALAALLHEARLGHSFAVSQVSAVVETTQKMRNTHAIDRPEALEARLHRMEATWESKQEELQQLYQHASSADPDPSIPLHILQEERQEATTTLTRIGEITEEEKKLLYEVKGARLQELQSLKTKIAALTNYETDMELDDLYQNIAHLEATLTALEAEKPAAPNTSVNAFKELKASIPILTAASRPIQDMQQELQLLSELGLKKPAVIDDNADTDASIQDLVLEYQELNDKKKKLQESRVISNYVEEDHKTWKKKYASWLKRNDGFIEDETSMEEYLEQKEDIRTQIAAQRDIQQYMQSMEELNAELQSYVDIPYNEQCWACKAQPWRKVWDSKTQKIRELKDTVSKLKKKHKNSLQDLEEELATLENWTIAKAQYERQKDVWDEQKKHWDATAKLWKQESIWSQEFQAVRASLARVGSQLWHIKAQLEEQIKHQHQLDVYVREKALHSAMRQWVKRYEPMEEELDHLRHSVEWKELSIRAEELEQSLEIDHKRLERMQQWDAAHQRIAEIDGIFARRAADDLEKELKELSGAMKETRMAYGHAQTEWEKHAALEKMYEAQKAYLTTLQTREAKLTELEQWFVGTGDEDGYKKWMYTAKVIPILQRELNYCLKGVEHLRMKIDYDKGGFTYTVEDGDRKPSLDKASGYQNFIISLCMRITLGRIGATRHDIRQLIIDEGFTSCDADNLTKMPEFLRTLLQKRDYDSVLLMSHLDGIRESTTMKIDIHQEGPFSRLTVGDPYQTPKASTTITTLDGEVIEPPKKTRGRPKKVIAVEANA